MAGNTAAIDVVAFRADWASHMPISVLCVNYTVTKDQVIRLRDHWELPKRLDRSLRFKPSCRPRDPTPREIARACRLIQATWDDATREDRAVVKTQHVTLRVCPLSDEARDALDGTRDDE